LVVVQLAGVIALVLGVILVARAPVFRELRLRELPHVALELLQHPLPAETAETDSEAGRDSDDRGVVEPPPTAEPAGDGQAAGSEAATVPGRSGSSTTPAAE
jgi:hypothetical protein